MNPIKPFLLAIAVLVPVAAHSQGLVPTIEGQFEFCNDRPKEPKWLQDIHVRESHKRLLIQAIYDLQSYERVEQAGDCACDTLYPAWDTAIQTFNDNFLHLERRDAMNARLEFQDRSTVLRQSQKSVCEPLGHW
ncbi:MAG: hypothetical protein AAFU69_11085 [Pseudomonadota bacterium]